MEPQAPAVVSHKKWYVIGGIILVLLAGALFYKRMTVKYGVDVKNNYDGSTTYSNEEGSVTLGVTKMPENWPGDAPDNFTGGKIQYSGTSNPQTGKAASIVVYSVSGTAAAVGEYYKKELTDKGWSVEATASPAGGFVLAAKKDTRTFGLTVLPADQGLVTVTAGIGL